MKQLQRQLKVLGLAESANVDEVDAAYRSLHHTWRAQLDSPDRKKQALAAQRLEALEDAYKLVRPFAKPVKGDEWADRMNFVARPEAPRPPSASAPSQDDGPTAVDTRWGGKSSPKISIDADSPWGMLSAPRMPLEDDTPWNALSSPALAERDAEEEEKEEEEVEAQLTDAPASEADATPVPVEDLRMEDAREFLMAARLAARQRRDLRAALRWRQDLRLVSFILLLPGLLGVPALVAADAWHQHMLHRRALAVATAATSQAAP